MKWKIYLSAAMAAVAAVALTGCNNDDPEPTPPPPPATSFGIEITEITSVGATVTVTPQDPEVWYHFAAVAKTEFEQHGNTPASYTQYFLKKLQEDNPAVPFAYLLDAVRTQGKGNRTYTNLTPETDYVAFAVAMNEEGACTCEGVDKAFRTPAPDPVQKVDCTFDVTFSDVSTMTATVDIVPSRDDVPYYYEALSEEEYAQLGGNAEGVAGYFDELFLDNADALGITVGEVVEFMCITGPDYWIFDDLKPDMLYHLCVCGYDEQGRIVTDLAVEDFHTVSVQPSDIAFTIEVSDVTASGALIECTPSNDDFYFFDVWAAADLAGLDDDAVVEMVETFYAWDIDAHIGRGPVQLVNEGMLEADTEYTIVAFGYDAYVRNSAITRQNFRTLPGGAPADCTFEISVDPLRPSSGTVHIRPSDSSVYYYFDLLPSSEYTTDAHALELVMQSLRAVAQEKGISVEEVVEQLHTRGRTSVETRLDPLTAYTVFAFAINPDGTAAGAVTTHVFATPEKKLSTATTGVTVDKYYDGDALYAYDPIVFAGVEDRALIPTQIDRSDDAAHWYTGLFTDDVCDAELYPDELIIENLVDQRKGVVDRSSMDFLGQWGDLTFLAVAEDATGNYGPVFRLFFPVDRQNASPIDDYVGGASPYRSHMGGTAPLPVATKGGLLRMRDFEPQPVVSATRRIVLTERVRAGRAARRMLGPVPFDRPVRSRRNMLPRG